MLKTKLAHHVKENGRAQTEGMELVKEAADPGVGDMVFVPAQNIGRAEFAVHVAMAGQLDKNSARRDDR